MATPMVFTSIRPARVWVGTPGDDDIELTPSEARTLAADLRFYADLAESEERKANQQLENERARSP